MIKTIITLAVSLVFANQSYAEENIEELIQEGVTFYASFDGQINADRAAGANKPNNIYGKKINYIDGVKGKALNGDNERILLIVLLKISIFRNQAHCQCGLSLSVGLLQPMRLNRPILNSKKLLSMSSF